MLTRRLNVTFAIAMACSLSMAAPVSARAELPHEKMHRFLFGDDDDDHDHRKKKKHKRDRGERSHEHRRSERHRCHDHNHNGYCDVCSTRLAVIEPAPIRVYPRVRYEYYRSYDYYDRYDRPIEVDVQIALQNRGYYRGPIDGDVGPGTRYAIREYQYDYRLPVTGRIDRYLLRSLGVR